MWVIRKTQANVPDTFLVWVEGPIMRWSENLADARRHGNLDSMLMLVDRLNVLPEHRRCEIEEMSVTE